MWLFLTPFSPGSYGYAGNRSATGEGLPKAANSGTVIESLSGQRMILNRKLARHYRRLLTESVCEGGIAMQMRGWEVILHASACSRRAGPIFHCLCCEFSVLQR